MNPAQSRWSPQVWIWGFVFLFLSHAFAVFWLADHQSPSPSWQKPPAFLYLSGAADTDLRVTETTALRDPTLFALPHPQNFSGGAWLNFHPQVPRLSNWTAPPEWLSLPVEELGKSLDEYVATNRPSEAPLLAALRAPRAFEVRIPDQPILTNSLVRVEGLLASRKLQFYPSLPNVPHNDVLARTVVTVSVNSAGVVESAAVAKESGLKSADDRALQLARAFTFEPLAARDASAREMAPPTFGRLVFTWNTVPPTNPVPATASLP